MKGLGFLDIRHRLCKFNGLVPHSGGPYNGVRCSEVGFEGNYVELATAEHWRQLKRLGFPVNHKCIELPHQPPTVAIEWEVSTPRVSWPRKRGKPPSRTPSG